MNRTCAADRHPLYYSNLSGRALWKELFPYVNLSSFNDSAKSMIRKHDMDQYLHEGWRRRAPRSSTSNNRREKRTLRDIRRSKQAQLLQHVPRSDSMGYCGAIEQHDETVGLNDSFFKIKDIVATNLRKEFSSRTTTHSKSSAWTQEQQAGGDAHRQQHRAQQQQLPGQQQPPTGSSGNSPHSPSKGHHPITPTALSTTPTVTGKQGSSRADHAHHHHPVAVAAESSDEKRKLLRSGSRERRKDRSDSRERRKDRSDSRERRKDRPDSREERRKDRSDSRERRKDRPDSRERRKDRPDSRERRKDRPDSRDERRKDRPHRDQSRSRSNIGRTREPTPEERAATHHRHNHHHANPTEEHGMHSRYKTSSHHHSAVEHTAPTSTQHKHMNLLYSEHDARSISSCEEDEENNDSTPSSPVGRDKIQLMMMRTDQLDADGDNDDDAVVPIASSSSGIAFSSWPGTSCVVHCIMFLTSPHFPSPLIPYLTVIDRLLNRTLTIRHRFQAPESAQQVLLPPQGRLLPEDRL